MREILVQLLRYRKYASSTHCSKRFDDPHIHCVLLHHMNKEKHEKFYVINNHRSTESKQIMHAFQPVCHTTSYNSRANRTAAAATAYVYKVSCVYNVYLMPCGLAVFSLVHIHNARTLTHSHKTHTSSYAARMVVCMS